MTLECPHFAARLNVPTPPPPDTPVRCGKCKTVFHTPAAADLEPLPDEPAAPIPEPVPAAEPASGDGFAFDPDDPPAPRPATRTSTRAGTKTPAAGGKKFPTLLVAGVLAAVVATAGLAYVLVSGGKPKPETANAGTPETPRPKPPVTPPPTTPPKIPAEFADLFKDTVDRPAPTVLVPTLQKVGKEDLAVPALVARVTPTPGAEKLTPDEVKKATAYIKVDAGEVSGSGSGFVIRADRDGMLIATNEHVAQPRQAAGPARITVVFDSGTPAERAVPAELVAADAEADLAVIRVRPVDPAPKPIDPDLAVAPKETMEVRVYGYPFGGILGLDGRNPNVTVSKGAVSSLRQDAAGNVSQVQFDGTINPGNSGGPVLDTDGRLVGVAVATIRGSGIGLAVPASELSALLAGRVSAPALIPEGVEDGKARFRVAAAVSDPLRRITGVALHVWNGTEAPAAEKDPAGGWKPVPGAERVELSPEARTRAALGEFHLPAPADGAAAPAVVLQLECRGPDGAVILSPPVPHKLALAAVQTAADAIPMANFRKDLATFAGQVVVVRGRLFSGAAVRRGAVFELQVTGDADGEGRPDKLTFVADRDVATQLAELPSLEQALPARLTLRVGKPGAGGDTPARVTRIDFIGRNNRLVKSIPAADPTADPLTALNRAPRSSSARP